MTISQPLLEKIIRDAGDIALKHFYDLKHLNVEKKQPRDFVTAADVEVEQFLQTKLRENYPQFGFWGEESGQTENQTNRWIVDPIDGTHSFSRGQYYWSISVALEMNNDIIFGAVFAPALNDFYCAQKGKGAFRNGVKIGVSELNELNDAMIGTGFACLRSYLENNNLARFCRVAQATASQRRLGSAAVDICLVADGQLDAFWEQELNLYDVAAGALIAKEAGATVTDFQGNAGIFPKQIMVTNGKIFNQLLALM